MQAQVIQIESVGGPEVMTLAERPMTEPGPTQIRIRHHACGVNFIDIYHRTGLYPLPMPAVLGEEGAGVVEAVGADVTPAASPIPASTSPVYERHLTPFFRRRH